MGTPPAAPLDARSEGWQAACVALLGTRGCAVVEGVLSPERCAAVSAALVRARARVREEAGPAALDAARDRGDAMIRFLEVHEPIFLETLALPPVLGIVDAVLGGDAVLRFQMGNAMPGAGDGGGPPTQPRSWHRNFGRVPGRPGITLEVALVLEDLGPGTGCPVVAPGSHLRADAPPPDAWEAVAEPLPARAGAMQVLAGTLWHRESPNLDARERLTLVQQYALPWVRPYFDYPRMLGEERLRSLPERTRRLLGGDARPPATPREFYGLPGERTFRARGGA